MEEFHELQRHIVNTRPLSRRVREAFFSVPRHRFVDRFREAGSSQWIELNAENLSHYLPLIYRDSPLVIWGEVDDFHAPQPRPVSTISQPSFVLYQLDLLDIHPGHSVFELGTGSGWNAALMGVLCKPGRVRTYEIIVPLAKLARDRLKRLGVDNVEVVVGDGMDIGNKDQFDRGIFTAGAGDLPLALHKAIRSGGRLLFVLQDKGSIDYLLVLRKTDSAFVAEKIIPCGFVPVTGQASQASFHMRPVLLELSGPVGLLRPQDLALTVVPTGQKIEPGENRVIVRQPQSTFVWSRR